MYLIRSRWFLNSGMNLLGGASAALVTFFLPPILARSLPPLEFSLWNLSLQIVAYLGLFGSGIHLATAKFTAQSEDPLDRQRTASAAFLMAGIGVLIAGVAVAGIAWFYPSLFPGVPEGLVVAFRSSVVWVGGSAALQLFALVPLGIFVGCQQNAAYVSAQVLARAVTLGCVWYAAARHGGLNALTATYAATSFLVVPLAYGALARVHPSQVRALWRRPELARFKELLGYCGGFLIWTVATLLVNSVDLILVGRMDMNAVPAYSLALALITVLAGVINAVVSPMLPVVSNLHSTAEGRRQLPALLNRATFWCSLACQCVLLGFLVLGRPFLNLYAGPYSEPAFPLLFVLLIATLLRHACYPYAIFLLGASLHHRAISFALVEGFVNLGASLFLGYRYGAMGVAYGTLIGVLASQAVCFLRTFPQTRELVPSTASYLYHGLGKSILPLSPVYLAIGIWFLFRAILQNP